MYIYIYVYIYIYICVCVDALQITSCTLRADIRRHIHGRRWTRSPRQGPRVARVLPTLIGSGARESPGSQWPFLGRLAPWRSLVPHWSISLEVTRWTIVNTDDGSNGSSISLSFRRKLVAALCGRCCRDGRSKLSSIWPPLTTRRRTATKSSSNFWMKGGRRKNGAKRWVSTYWRSLPYVNGAAVPGSALTVAKERQVCLSLKKLGQLGDGSCYNAVAWMRNRGQSYLPVPRAIWSSTLCPPPCGHASPTM